LSEDLLTSEPSEQKGLSLGFFAALLAVTTLATVLYITRITSTPEHSVTQFDGQAAPALRIDGAVPGFVDRVVTHTDGNRRVLAVDLWAAPDSPITAVKFSSLENLSVVALNYQRPDLATIDGAEGITIMAVASDITVSDITICIALKSDQGFFFISELSNCWSF